MAVITIYIAEVARLELPEAMAEQLERHRLLQLAHDQLAHDLGVASANATDAITLEPVGMSDGGELSFQLNSHDFRMIIIE